MPVLNWWVSVFHMEISFCVRTLESEVVLLQNIALPLGVGVIIVEPSRTQFKLFSRKTKAYKIVFF